LYLPKQAREMRLKQAQEWFKETYFCWIGGYSDKEDEVFYYRIQSPVVVIEYDDHSGVFVSFLIPSNSLPDFRSFDGVGGR
jgi:hypothetical protein